MSRRSTRSMSREVSETEDEERKSNIRPRPSKGKGKERTLTIAEVEDEDGLVPTSNGEREAIESLQKDVSSSDEEKEEKQVLDLPETRVAATVTAASLAPKGSKLKQRIGALFRKLLVVFPFLPPLLIFASFLLALLLPSPSKPFARKVYVDENALQPGAADVSWDWGEVQWSDKIAGQVQMVADDHSGRRAAFLTSELRSLGMTPYNQSYTFTLPASKRSHSTRNMPRVLTGINTYARWSSARGDGREALVICAPWRSQWDGSDDPDAEREDQANRRKLAMEGSMGDYERSQVRRPNVRGVSTVLSLARFLIGHSHWSKDLIFVFGDGHLDGMQAWTSTYFASEQSNLLADRIQGAGALVWNAMAFDYPSDSFSSIVVRHEGLDGQLPNLDVINTLTRVAERINGVPIELSESLVPPRFYQRRLGSLGTLLEEHLWDDREGEAKYMGGLLNVLGQLRNLVVGHPTGVHGLFHRFHVDAITLFAKPAPGPYGFWHMGRMAESMTRSFSNLLERLHHSQFFYLITSTQLFIEVAKCIAVAALLGAAMTIRGISIWLDEGKRAQHRREALVELAQESAYQAKIDQLKSNGNSLLYDDQADGDDDEDDEEDEEVPLESPTLPQILNELISSSILGATRKGHVLSASRIKALTKLLDIQGRPVPAAIALVGCCHLAGGACFWLSSTAPVDCASRGLSKCDPLLAITLVTLFAAILLPIAAARWTMAASEGIIKECQIILSPSPSSHTTTPASRTASLARLLQAATLLHAGILVIAASIVNFSLAAATAGLLCLPLCSLNTASGQREKSRSGQRLNRTFWFFILLLVSPAGLVWLLKGLAEASIRYSGSTQTLAGIPLTAVVERIVDGRLWDWQVLGATFLPYLFLAYMPAALQGCIAAGLAAIA